ncbi:MAG: hypothetical protein K0R45_2115, partial [Pseudomonas sp.]|nr:hypothetical protein [Pseudomonas sp.]
MTQIADTVHPNAIRKCALGDTENQAKKIAGKR